MRWLLSIVLSTASVTGREALQPPAPVPPAAPSVDLEVHEWGTFTSMVGSDGVGLEGLHHEEEALPDFVHDLLRIREVPDGLSETKLPASHVTQKMETPVIYFHARRPMRVRVDVTFRQGLMTQFYPLPSTVRPPLAELRSRRIDVSRIDDSSLSWDVDVFPAGQPAPAGIPVVGREDPWHFARQVRSACVRTRPPARSGAQPEAEHYLFYRGVGRFELSLGLRAEPGGRAVLQNDLAGDIPFAAALEMGHAGGRLQVLGRVPEGATREVELGKEPMVQERAEVGRRLGALLMKALVGRLEYVTPEVEILVERALCGRLHASVEERERARAFLTSLDRFLEPYLRRALSRTADPLVRLSGAELLSSLEQ